MNKIPIIIKREYMTRVRKKSFIIMTLLAPLLLGSLFLVMGLTMSTKDKTIKKIAVVDDNGDAFKNSIPDIKDAKFVYLPGTKLEDLKKSFDQAGYYAILYIGPVGSTGAPITTQLVFKKNQPPIDLLEHIQSTLGKDIERQKLMTYKIRNLDSILNAVKTRVKVTTVQIDEKGAVKETSTGVSMILAYAGGFLMYMLVFMFGAQVMRGVIEEKTSRVVEVIISSVKPVQLMMGKIVGIALVGLTQFLIWIVLTVVSVTILKTTFLPKTDFSISQSATGPQSLMSANLNTDTAKQVAELTPQQAEIAKLFASAMNQDWGLIIFSFIFYFLTGYLLYASVFAAIGSAVDNETETQQFMLPVTLPIVFGLLVAMGTMRNPESPLALWCSMIPLTSPIVMMARIPFGVPYWQLGLSMIIMLGTFGGFVWMAAKIYRTGILMYGKKTSWKEMWKWLKYSG
jgi:ABC-2 type transport system permease protein